MDKVNTQTNIADIEDEYLELKAANEVETRHLEEQFTERSKKQRQLMELEAEIEKVRESKVGTRYLTNLSTHLSSQEMCEVKAKGIRIQVMK